MKKLLLLLLLSPGAFAADYYVRADGTATKASATSSSAASTSMSLTTFNGETFAAGDTIYFSGNGGDFSAQVTIPSSGSSGNEITYECIEGCEIDVTSSATSEYAILVRTKDYLNIVGFDLRGSGGAAAFRADINAGKTGRIDVIDSNVLSNTGDGTSTGGNDCWSTDAAYVDFTNVTATDCHEFGARGGSHQAITLHNDSDSVVTGGTFSDANNLITNVDSSTMVVNGGVWSCDYSGSWAVASASGGATLEINNATLNMTADCNMPTQDQTVTSGSPLLTVNGGTINISSTTASSQGFFRAPVVFDGVAFNISSDYSYSGFGTTADITFTDNTVTLTGTGINNREFIYVTDGQNLLVARNVFQGVIDQDLIELNNTTTGSVEVISNVFDCDGTSGSSDVLWIRSNNANPTVAQNVFYDCDEAIDNDHGTGSTLVQNNIFSEGTTSINLTTDMDLDNNNYYNTSNAGGTGATTVDPKFSNPAGGNFTLQSDSTMYAGGVEWWTGAGAERPTGINGTLFSDPPNVGAYAPLAPLITVLQAPTACPDGSFATTGSTADCRPFISELRPGDELTQTTTNAEADVSLLVGTLYAYVDNAGDAAPTTCAAIQAGTGAIDTSSKAVASSTVNLNSTDNFTSLIANTSYKLYACIINGARISEITASAAFSTLEAVGVGGTDLTGEGKFACDNDGGNTDETETGNSGTGTPGSCNSMANACDEFSDLSLAVGTDAYLCEGGVFNDSVIVLDGGTSGDIQRLGCYFDEGDDNGNPELCDNLASP